MPITNGKRWANLFALSLTLNNRKVVLTLTAQNIKKMTLATSFCEPFYLTGGMQSANRLQNELTH